MKEYQKFDFYQEEEDYLSEMSARGYQIKTIDNGNYTFEQEEGRFFFRMYYISDLSDEDLDELVEQYAQDDIEIVLVDGIWAYFRSEHPFHMYNRNQQEEIMKKIAKRYRKTGYLFLLASVGFAAAAIVAGSALYVGMVIFCVLGLDYLRKSNYYRKERE